MMDQLYEAMPIPSSSDDDAHHDDGDAASGLNVSAHSSFSSFSDSAAQSSDEDESNNADARDSAYHRVFTTTSSPDDLYQFLVEMLQEAEHLHRRLCAVMPEEGPTHPRAATAAASSSAAKVRNEEQTGSTSTAAEKHGNNNNGSGTLHHAFIGETSCHGAAKVRGRLRKELENLRRTVDGLRDAGCTGGVGRGSGDVVIPPALFSAAVTCAQCNSIAHFDGVVTCLEREGGVTGVYVPVSGHVGPAPRRTAGTTTIKESDLVVGRPASFSDAVRIEVDVVSCHEHRWIKVKTATARNLALEAAALELNGSTPFTDMLLALTERAGRTCLPHRRVAHVAVVLLHPPPPPLQTFFAVHRIAWASLTAGPTHSASATECAPSSSSLPSTSWLPTLSVPPLFVCLDTTALVTFCSQSCYVDGLPLTARLARLAPYHVLQEQQRKEAVECAAVAAVMEPALRAHTWWGTLPEMEETMRQALLRPDEMDDAASTHTAEVNLRQASVPASLTQAVDLSWLPPLYQAAEMDGYTHSMTSLDESELLREMTAQLTDEPVRRPNWIVADVTYEEFRWILETIAGPEEVTRAARLLRLVTVVHTGFLRARMKSDGDSPTASTDKAAHDAVLHGRQSSHLESSSNHRTTTSRDATADALLSPSSAAAMPHRPLFTNVEYLRVSGKVSLRNKVVFGLADAVGAVIVTSNEQLCHAAREQGVCVEACFHPSRSLTEQKVHQLRRRHGPGKPPAVL